MLFAGQVSYMVCTFHQWLSIQATGRHAVLFSVALWTIWRWRNSVLFDPNSWSLGDAVRFLRFQYQDCIEFLQDGHNFDLAAGPSVRWKPPGAGSVKLNCDGSFNPSGNLA